MRPRFPPVTGPALAIGSLLFAVSCGREDAGDRAESDGDPRGAAAHDPGFAGVSWRAVWSQSLQHPDDPWQRLPDDRLCVAERIASTETGSASQPAEPPPTRVLLDGPGSFVRPFFSPDGNTIYYSTRLDDGSTNLRSYETHAIGWDGGDGRRLADGFACDTWTDPASGQAWMFAAEDLFDTGRVLSARRIVRYPIGEPQDREVVWDAAEVTVMNPEIAHDGKTFSSTFPWPNGGVAELGTTRWEKTENGCWPSLLPGSSEIGWVFDGTHRNAQIWSHGQKKSRLVRLNGNPDMLGYEIYHPRWTNHPNFFAHTGPYLDGEGGNRIGFGGPAVEVYIGKFDNALTRIVAWERVTTNDVADFAPDVWIADGAGAAVDPGAVIAAFEDDSRRDGPAPQRVEVGTEWPGTDEGLLLIWADNRSTNDVALPDGTHQSFQFVPEKGARFGPRYDLNTTGGHFVLDQDPADRLALEIGNRSEFTIELVLTPKHTSTGGIVHTILSLGDESGIRNLTLAQEDGRYHLRVRTMGTHADAEMSALTFGEVTADEPAHLLVTYREGEIRTYLNGDEERSRRVVYKELGNWTPLPLIIGDAWAGGSDWHGHVEALAIYGRTFAREEAVDHFGLAMQRIGNREPIETVRTRGRLVAVSEPPNLQGLGGYRRHLSAYTYELEGGPLAGEEVAVLHWTILDREHVPGFPRTVGQTYDLALQPHSAHPQLRSESSDVPDDFSLETYVDVGD
ncbi:hypothetical protein BH23VER1_BH23VER1_31560 [soil metagenome]